MPIDQDKPQPVEQEPRKEVDDASLRIEAQRKAYDDRRRRKSISMRRIVQYLFYPFATPGPRQAGVPTRYVGFLLIIAGAVMEILAQSAQFPGFQGYLQKYALQIIAVLCLITGIVLVVFVASILSSKKPVRARLAPPPPGAASVAVPEKKTEVKNRACTKCGTVNPIDASACIKCHEPF
nr:hypothetical protein [Candidatus Sigynarchaeota archaeon]